MKKSDFISRYGEERYKEYLEKQRLLAKKWREKNGDKSREYGREYYWSKKNEEGRK